MGHTSRQSADGGQSVGVMQNLLEVSQSPFQFVDLADLNRQALDWLNSVANVRLHGTTGEVPFARLPLEELQSVDVKPTYDTSLITYRRSSSDCLVSYAGNYYSVPALYAKQRLLVKETEQDELIVFTLQGDEIARHRLAVGHNQRIVVSSHYQGLSSSSRPAQRPSAVQLEPTLPALLAAPAVEARPLHFYERVLEVQP